MGVVEGEFQRLPKTFIPLNYDITIKPNFDKFTFEGTEIIEIKVTAEGSSSIVLNAADLTVSKAVWICKGGDGLERVPASVSLDDTQETLRITFQFPLEQGEGFLRLEFQGTINDKLKGFYRSKFKGEDGQDKYNGVTQFAATDARRAFPCFDEPSPKATFDITLIADKERIALSNMPVKEVVPYPQDENLQIVKFHKSPKMSTYLVAFCIGYFEYVETTSEDGVLVRVYTKPGKKEQGKFALSVAAKVLPYYKEYFGIAYPLPKLDLIAVADFAYGAMENWGLITYRETFLLVDPSETSASSRQNVALVVGHEIAHQWFGNLVTMDWWTHLWLNEGYASFVEFLCVDFVYPEYEIWTQFVTEMYGRALELDALSNSHPIEVPVGHPREIDEIFDNISYSKGASIIRMLHRYIGDSDFRKGMNIYLTRHQYGNTHTVDLWEALEEASGEPIGLIMETWTKQMGFPVILVDSAQDGNVRKLNLTQNKYSADPTLKDSRGYKWMIPISFCTASDPTKPIYEILMQHWGVPIAFPGVGPDEWMKLNPGSVGFYRVRYQPDLLAQFIPAIRDKTLPPLDRVNILDDLFAMAQCGESSTVEVFKMLDAYKDDDNFTVWSSISNVMAKLNLLWAYTSYYDTFKEFGRRLFRNIGGKLGWEAKPNESHLDTMLRTLVLLRLASFDDKEVIEESKSRLALHMNAEQSIAPDLRSVVYRCVMSGGDENTLEMMLKMYRDSDMLEEKERIGRSLGVSKDQLILKKVLDFAISDDVRSQDSVSILSGVSMSKEGRQLAWNFFRDHKDLFKERYPGGNLLPRLVKNTTENFVTEESANEIFCFFRDNPFPGTERTVKQALENIRINEAWLKRDEPLAKSYLVSAIKAE